MNFREQHLETIYLYYITVQNIPPCGVNLTFSLYKVVGANVTLHANLNNVS